VEGAQVTDELAEIVAELRGVLDRRSPWMDANEVAEYLRLSPKTIQNLSAPGAERPLPYYRIAGGGQKRFHRDEVNAWLTAKNLSVSLASTNGAASADNGPAPGHEEG
jgi:excisionase family DNA binding protein